MGCIDKEGRWVIRPRFTNIGEFVNGLAPATVGDAQGRIERGYIGRDGNWAIGPGFDYCSGNWYGDIVYVQLQGGQEAYLDRTGRVVVREPHAEFLPDRR